MTPPEYLLILPPEASLVRRGARLYVKCAGWKQVLHTGSPAAAAALARLRRGVSEADFAEPATHYCLEQLRNWNLLNYRLPLGRGFIHVRPCRPGFRLRATGCRPDVRYVLSRFAFLRGQFLESPLAEASLVLSGPEALAAVTRFFSPRAADPESLGVAKLLLATKFLEAEGATEPSAQVTWEFHDLLFQHRTAAGDSWKPLGRTERFRSRVPQPPKVKPPMSRGKIALPRPNAAKLRQSDPPLAWVSDARKSLHTPGARPITLPELAEFLWRVARLPRPLPAAGGLHELEFYALVDRCQGLAPGLYYYAGADHAIHPLPASPSSDALISAAQARWGPHHHRPQVVIVVAARFARMAWSYQSIAYRNVLLDAGVALHAMYLAATAMNLAACAIGWNDPRLFAAAAGLDPLEESSVALFVVNSRPAISEEP